MIRSLCVRVYLCVYLFLCLAICSSLFIVPIYMSIIMSIHTCWSIYGQRWHICSRLNAASSRVPAWSWASFDSAGCKMITRAETSTKCTKLQKKIENWCRSSVHCVCHLLFIFICCILLSHLPFLFGDGSKPWYPSIIFCSPQNS